ncbi:MAG: septum formation protein Maf [Verrucomicrobia bacterium]|nr:septum formation protein Maf [Verrucomicrobiota bacterium]
MFTGINSENQGPLNVCRPVNARLILASKSPRRLELLLAAGFSPFVVAAEIDESRAAYLAPSELARFNAFQKATAVGVQYPGEIVLGADTVVVVDNVVFGKPRDLDEARWMLRLLSGRAHDVVTGIVVVHQQLGRSITDWVWTEVMFPPLSENRVQRYVEVVSPLDKAGGYAAQNSSDQIISSYRGSFTNIVGLPMERTVEVLRDFGIISAHDPDRLRLTPLHA